ncbi:hypothetical protein HanPI659440_Chr17g0700991 [Helianthus annuus]|nr:hypothetical protein HanPI659440_Chr17g0700991 [Helianthus annuus]
MVNKRSINNNILYYIKIKLLLQQQKISTFSKFTLHTRSINNNILPQHFDLSSHFQCWVDFYFLFF